MSTKYTTILSSESLEQILPEQPLILDCRAKLGDAAWGYGQFLQGRIPTAVHADLDRHLAAPPGEQGRHPLPTKQAWVAQLRAWGLNNDRQVVTYDDAGGAYAARAWWMLRWLGHDATAVLDGGMQRWRGKLDHAAPPEPRAGDFQPQQSLVTAVSVEQVESFLASNESNTANEAQAPHLQASHLQAPHLQAPHLIDARSQARWAGLEEPIDAIAGHIPGSTCLPFQGNLSPQGTFLAPQDLHQRFADLAGPLVCYCGSGVTACHNILALHIAGRDAALFVDSWSGWITNPAHPIGVDGNKDTT